MGNTNVCETIARGASYINDQAVIATAMYKTAVQYMIHDKWPETIAMAIQAASSDAPDFPFRSRSAQIAAFAFYELGAFQDAEAWLSNAEQLAPVQCGKCQMYETRNGVILLNMRLRGQIEVKRKNYRQALVYFAKHKQLGEATLMAVADNHQYVNADIEETTQLLIQSTSSTAPTTPIPSAFPPMQPVPEPSEACKKFPNLC